MEFWGEEVKPGQAVSCEAGDGFVIHLSQAALGETKKGSENVVVYVKVGDKKLVIATLSADKHPQMSCDLIFDEAFELSHSSKTTSVFLCAEELENVIPLKNNENGKSAAKLPAKDDNKDKQDDDEESDDSGSDSDDFDSGSDSEDDSMSEDDSSDDSEDEDEETPVKPVVGKKRAAETSLKTPASDKKAKITTPKKETGDKKGVHVATPHPAKQSSKTPTDGKQKGPKTPADSKPKEKAPKTPADSKAKEKSPKSGSHSCKSCSKTFNSAVGLESHQKAKKHDA
ncbi:hypothetical protein EJB05_17567 [Eragrostis curvula]|uniref:C2H2-type domain-containing protein n=1 Tax=Eragrostis curvula TaxID=38414 RepID=A0A5J9VJK5_9POAL|nr:hypothetical protein EJB05_17567 [Eragrostis curvula]